MERVTIKLLENPNNPKLKMKYVGSYEYATPKLGTDGKIKTGLDELSQEVMAIEDSKKREALQKKLVKERGELERLLGVSLDPHSDYWGKFYIILSDEDIELDQGTAIDRLKERFLIANGYVAPSREAIEDDERYMNCIFYIHREVEETTKKVEKQKKFDKATAKLFLLNEENPNKLQIVASYLFGYEIDAELNPSKAYEKLSDYINEKSEKVGVKNIEAFLDAVAMSPEEMQVKLILDRAISKRIVTKNKGVYRRGDKVIGNDYEDALANLKTVEFNSELLSLKKEIDKK